MKKRIINPKSLDTNSSTKKKKTFIQRTNIKGMSSKKQIICLQSGLLH